MPATSPREASTRPACDTELSKKTAGSRVPSVDEPAGDQPVTVDTAVAQKRASLWLDTSESPGYPALDRRLSVDAVKSPAGHPLQVRTEPTSLAGRIKLSGAMPRMSLATFMKEQVTPQMAALFGKPLYDPATNQGFGCGGCHKVNR